MLLGLTIAYGSLLALVSLIAWGKRSSPLRLACVTLAVGWLFSVVMTNRQLGWRHLQIGIFAADCAVLTILIAIALWSRRRWSMLAAAAQLAAVAVHLGFAQNPGLWFPAYAGALQIFGWILVGCLTIGGLSEPNNRMPQLQSKGL